MDEESGPQRGLCGATHHTLRWFVLAATFFIQMTVDGYNMVCGPIKLELHQQYPTIPEWLIAMTGSMIPGLYCLLSPLAEIICKRIGMRLAIIIAAVIQLTGFMLVFANHFLQWGYWLDFLGFGFIQGLASALLYGTSIADITKQFDSRSAFAAGVATAGSPAGAIFYGLLFQFFKTATPLGWRGSSIFFAVLSSVNFVCGALYKLPKNHHSSEKPVEKNKSFCTDFKNQFDCGCCGCCASGENDDGDESRQGRKVKQRVFINFLVLLTFTSLFIMGYYVPILLLSGQAADPQYGVSKIVQNNIVWIWGLSNLVGRIFFGWLADFHTVLFCQYSLFFGSAVISSIAVFVFPHVMALGDAAFIIFTICYGLFVAPGISLRMPILKQVCGEDNAGRLFANMLLSDFVFVVVGFCVSSKIESISPMWAYTAAGICFAAAAVCLLPLGPFYYSKLSTIRKNFENKKQEREERLRLKAAHAHLELETTKPLTEK